MFAIKIQLSIKIEKNNIKIRSNLAAASLYMAYHCNKDDRQIIEYCFIKLPFPENSIDIQAVTKYLETCSYRS